MKPGLEKTEIVKTCIHHGPLTREQVNINGGNTFRCKKCRKISHIKHYETHKHEVKLKHKEYRDNNKEKVAASKRESWLRHKHKYLEKRQLHYREHYYHNYEKERLRDNLRKTFQRQTLGDYYVKARLQKQTGISAKEIPDYLVELKRVSLTLRRSIKHKKQREKENG
jgi:hypothetical protein